MNVKFEFMKKNVLFLIISALSCLSVSAQSFKESFKQALDVKDMVKAEEILKAWDLANANDPELYVSYFNFYTVESLKKDSKAYDKAYAKKALEFITEGIERYPTRFDMRVAKIYMLGELEDYPSYTSEIIKMIDYSDKIKNNWKGEDFRLVDKPEDMFLGAVLDFQEFLFSKEGNPSRYEDVIRISKKMQEHYPNHTQSLLNMSTVYIIQKKYDESLKMLLKAKEADSQNVILLYNIAYVYMMKEDRENAKKYFELVVAKATEEEQQLKEAAQKQIEALK